MKVMGEPDIDSLTKSQKGGHYVKNLDKIKDMWKIKRKDVCIWQATRCYITKDDESSPTISL